MLIIRNAQIEVFRATARNAFVDDMVATCKASQAGIARSSAKAACGQSSRTGSAVPRHMASPSAGQHSCTSN